MSKEVIIVKCDDCNKEGVYICRKCESIICKDHKKGHQIRRLDTP